MFAACLPFFAAMLIATAAYELTDKWSVNAAYRMEAAERATRHTLNIGAGRTF